MRKSFQVGACTLLALVLMMSMGCSSKQEKAQAKEVGLMSHFADLLAGIKSNTDFVDAKPKLERLGAQMKDARNEMKDLPSVSAKEQARLDKAFEAKMEPVGKRIQSEITRLSKIGVSPYELMNAMHLNMGEMMGN